MDITVYNKLYEVVERAITDFNVGREYKVTITTVSPQTPKYPLVVFEEITNQPRTRYYGSREQISTLGYRFNIFAKAVKSKTNQTICREIMQVIVDFMQKKIGLNLISNNPLPREGTNGEIFRQAVVFQKPYNENREKFY